MSSSASFSKLRGFTLVELMICVSIASILLSVSVPSLGAWLERTAVLAEVEQFESAVYRARMESVARGEPVSVCALDPAANASAPTCLPSGTDWSAGWVVFVDRGTRGSVERDDPVLLVHQASARMGTIDATLRYITFGPLGISNSAASNVQFRPRSAKAADPLPTGSQLVCINKPGRTRVIRTASCA